MIEPTLALQTAIRAALIGAVPVPADHIRSGSTTPEQVPCIRMTNGITTMHGHDYRAQRLAWVYLDLHVWAEDEDRAKEIAFAALPVLNDRLRIEGGDLDHFEVSRVAYVPDPTFGHAILSVEALVRWAV